MNSPMELTLPQSPPRASLLSIPGGGNLGSSLRNSRPPATAKIGRRGLRPRQAAGAGPARQGRSKDNEHEGSSTGSTHEPSTSEEPWTIQQAISLLSGFVSSVLSANAYSKQREAVKDHARLPRSQEDGDSGSTSVQDERSSNIVQQLGGSLLDAEAQSPLFCLGPVPACTEASDIRRPGRHFTIITTAAIPWRTGTAVNPLLRALYLAKSGRPTVLIMPFLNKEDQIRVYGPGTAFENEEEQEKVVRTWCREKANMKPDRLDLQFRWYPAKYVRSVRCIFPTGDCSKTLREDDPKDVLILEEPEHLCWYHHGARWPNIFSHVIGVIHTNYTDYLSGMGVADMKDEKWIGGALPVEVKEASIVISSTLVCSAYCDVGIKLSGTIMPLPNEVTCNVHGVRDDFLRIGDRSGSPKKEQQAPAYYLGKCVFEKGWSELIRLLKAAGPSLSGVVVDGYGSGPDEAIIASEAASMADGNGARMNWHPGIDHADEQIHGYSILVNPSTSDVLCTVTVEALAMGKQCVLARHVSNRFFEQFTGRCRFFTVGDAESFVQAFQAALAAGPPSPLPSAMRQTLTWDAANERLFDSAEVRVLSGPFQRPSEAAASRLAYRLHYDVMKDKTVLADVIKEVTIGTEDGYATPWDEYLSEWRKSQLEQLRNQARSFRSQLADRTDHLLEYETYLKDRWAEISEIIIPGKKK